MINERSIKSVTELKNKKLFLFDMDGTIYIDGKLFAGIKELLAKIDEKGGKYVFITNNSSKSLAERVSFLNKTGIICDESNFMTSTMAAAELLKSKFGKKRIYVQATASCVKELKTYGLNVTEDEEDGIAAVLVGYDTELNYLKMLKTCKILTERDIPYFATNPDWVCPVSFGYAPDCGSMCFGYEKATGRRPVFIGKPDPCMIFACMDKFGCTKEETLVIGDRLYTDIASGVNAEVDALFVLSGEGTLNDLDNGEYSPSFVSDSAADITPFI